jgi:hypothetical protein
MPADDALPTDEAGLAALEAELERKLAQVRSRRATSELRYVGYPLQVPVQLVIDLVITPLHRTHERHLSRLYNLSLS